MAKQLQMPLLLVITLLLIPITAALPGEQSHLLDGMAFAGNNGEKGMALDPAEDEEIVFENGRFRSVSCEPYNFDDSEYSATMVGDTVHFQAVTHSPTHGTIAWQGVVAGDTAEMTFLWTKERWYWDIRKEYWFRGTRTK